MEATITVNNKEIQATTDETILMALRRHGITIPTICEMEGFTPTGACRMCVVSIKGEKNLKTACSTLVRDGMQVDTHSPSVIKARKKITELLLADHPDDCLYCHRNNNCELQQLADELHIRQRSFPPQASAKRRDLSGASIMRDPSKCILCSRCVRVCEEKQGNSTLGFALRGHETEIHTAFNQGLNLSNCINCGQCIMVCPTGALHEKSHLAGVQDALNNPEKTTVAQIDPALTVSLSHFLNFKSGKDLTNLVVSTLKRMGFQYVFDTGFAGDLWAMEEASILKSRIEQGIQAPMLSSSCPAWVKYAEQTHHQILENLSPCKSPQQIMGSLLNRYWSEQKGIHPASIYSVSLAPCTARKFEAQRDEMTFRGVSAVDAVLTTREFIELIRLNGIDMTRLEESRAHNPFNSRSTASRISSVAGGSTEAVVRALYHMMEKESFPGFKIKQMRGLKSRKEYTAKIGSHEIKLVAVNGQHEANKLLEEVKKGRNTFHYIEVMACENGCIGGGGQPIIDDQQEHIKQRYKIIYDMDRTEAIKEPGKNPGLQGLFEKLLKEPGSKKCRELIHTHYYPREVYL